MKKYIYRRVSNGALKVAVPGGQGAGFSSVEMRFEVDSVTKVVSYCGACTPAYVGMVVYSEGGILFLNRGKTPNVRALIL